MNLTFRVFQFIIVVGMTTVVTTSGISQDKEGQVGLLFAGHFESADVTSDVVGAKKVQLAAAYCWRYGVRLFTDESWEKTRIKWQDFSEKAGQLADKLSTEMKPELVRDHNGVIDYAIATGGSSFFSSVITSPVFLEAFSETLGDKIHVIIIDRNILYVFPATGGKLAAFSPALVEIFETTPMPVSLEVFQVDRNGYQVVGEISREPGDITIDRMDPERRKELEKKERSVLRFERE